ncbi:glycerophosphoryl diester phosphodiesterase membrane domain-containing protein [Halovivax sp.]|uniref:glycerophosphoryl diester phosphodiesterase membrane domain-containing protein n=1 Tax=Halovivax sp. TaxID=1935978 RepID=UPI0025BE35E3|nr:glycerophosphoryl diester phosphodiesterase membrane domain-containing protein [Halovivax sp.]
MTDHVPRKDSVGTMGDAFDWLRRNPVLVALFFLVGVVDAVGQEAWPFAIVGALLMLYFGGIAHLVARDELRGAEPDLGAASVRVLGRMLSLVAILVVYAISVVVGLLLLILPGIYLALRLSLAFPACVIDDRGAVESLSTSWEVAKGNLLKLLGITLIAFFVILVAAIFAVPFAGAGAPFLLAYVLLVAVISAALQPIVEMAYARVYLENRDDGASDVAGATRHEEPDDRRREEWGTGDDANW